MVVNFSMIGVTLLLLLFLLHCWPPDSCRVKAEVHQLQKYYDVLTGYDQTWTCAVGVVPVSSTASLHVQHYNLSVLHNPDSHTSWQ
jgi:hypothetical protein